ncbi:MAG TPA: N-acetylglucosamine-6-phosphate deacetylase [Pelolinea sp.]|nr:N-acetylglucosamine-6-phosphate deacetylase [Pelolinea sp.]
MPRNKIALISKSVITPFKVLDDSVILIDGEKITAVENQRNLAVPDGYKVVDVGKKVIAPGFIDIHNHGGLGKMVDEGGKSTILSNSKRLVETGCTAWLPTVDSLYGIRETVSVINELTEGSRIIGIHMEGPFLTPKEIGNIKGIDYGVETPSMVKFQEFVDASEDYLKIMGVSVELEGIDIIIKELKKLGIVPAVAHSTKATYEQFMHSVHTGIRHVTHTYNVMTGLHHRKPGVVGGALTCEQVTNEIISDGFHVSPVAMDILLRCKGIEKVCIITDNTSVAGLPDGEYEMAGATIIKEGGISRYANSTENMDHTMAGSEWPINHNVKEMIENVGVKVCDAIRMASINPAKVIGMDSQVGSIDEGKDADIIVIDDDIKVYLTMIRGKICYDPTGLVH